MVSGFPLSTAYGRWSVKTLVVAALGVRSQSSRISAVWLFVWVQLLRHDSEAVRAALAAPQARLIPNLRCMGTDGVGRWRHVQVRPSPSPPTPP